MTGCDHKFLGSNTCAKCGWVVPRNVRPVNPKPLRLVPVPASPEPRDPAALEER